MASGPLSFSTTESLRKKLLSKNLEPYFVNGSTSPKLNAQDVGTKETEWIELPLVNQQDLDKSGEIPQIKLNVLNQYGPDNGRGSSVVFKNQGTKSNQGEFIYQTDNTNKFKESEQEQKELLVLNRFAPQNGWSDAASELESKIIQPQIRDEYVSDSLKPNLYRPSKYTSAQIYLQDNPTGSDGTLSQDSILAQLGAKKLKQLFLDSVAFEIRQQTTGRANAIIAAQDPYLASKIITGRAPLIEPNWSVTVPDSALGKTVNFAARITGAYSPFSYIPGDYFSFVQPTSLLNQTINRVAGFFGSPNILPTRKTASDIFLAYTGQGTRKLLFGSLSLNKFAPDYRANFINQLGLSAPKGNYYVGSRTSEPLDIVSPSGQIPVNEYGKEVETNVYGPSVLGKLYENDLEFKFGLNQTSTIDGGGLQGGFTWVSPKYKGNAGFNVGKGGDPKGQDPNYQPIAAQYTNSESTQFRFKQGSILDDTQRLINSQPNGGKRLQHVGNAIDQVSKVFNDGYKEITKGSRVIKYVDQNGTFVGTEYGRVFAKDIPYYENTKLQKTEGNIRKNANSILDKTYNLNIFPTTGPDSTTISDGRVKKYMLSIENLAWRTSRRPGLTYADLPESEKGPNGGRVMWFPPYDLSFSDDSTVDWNSNTFLGRPEAIYTYKGTSRGGSLSFKIVVDHPSIMNLIVNNVLSNTNSSQVADQVLDSFFAGLTKFDIYELAKKYQNFSPTELQKIQDTINQSSNPEKIKDSLTANLNKGGTGAGGPMTSNASIGLQDYKPQLSAYINSEFFFNYNQSGGNSYSDALNQYESDNNFKIINNVQSTEIKNSYSRLENLSNQIKSTLDTNPNVTIKILLKSNSSYNEATTVKKDRLTCIEESIIKIVGKNTRLTFENKQGNDSDKLPTINYPCNSATTNNYAVGPVGCRRVIIDNIIETPLPNQNNPNGGTTQSPSTVVGNIASQFRLNNSLNNIATNDSSNLTESVSKAVLRKLLNESNYFQFIKENNPYIYDSLKEKLKFFHPSFHSITPEGLNSRLTFLMQCTRPGDTIPTKQADGTFLDKDARNTSFGAPPICVIRIGDFYHTKAVISNVKFSYEDKTLDLNPEGIGVQPMIVGVSISFNFIGGQSLKGPIDELQNALSFNFFANTEMYDERATVLTESAYDKQFIENTQPEGTTIQNTNTDLSNEAGEFIGKLNGELGPSGLTGNNNYKNVIDSLIGGYEQLYNGIYDKLEQINTDYNWGVLQIYTSERMYKLGNIGTTEVEIFGYSNNFKKNIDVIFTTLKNDINNKSFSLFNGVSEEKNKNTLLKNLINIVTRKESIFYDGLETITKQLSQAQLDYVRLIDKINFVSGNVDGIKNKNGEIKLYTTLSANTINQLLIDGETITESSTNMISDLVEHKIIYNYTNYSFDKIDLFGQFSNSPSNKRFYIIFGDELVDPSKYKSLENEITKDIKGHDSKTILRNFNSIFNVKDIINFINKESLKKFREFKKENPKFSTLLPNDWNKLRKSDRPNSLQLQVPINDTTKTQFEELYSGVNSQGDKFNGKFTF
jgi:hypothetical protein